MANKPVHPPSRLYRCWRCLRFFIIVYVLIVVMLMLMENYLLFHPVRASNYWLSPGELKVEDVEFTSSDGTRIHAWWCPREGATGAVLYCHGNAGNLSYRRGAVADWLVHFGESVLIFDYPGFGRSEGSPTEAGCYAAAEGAYRWLSEKQGIEAERIIIYGKSLGGGVAVNLAERFPHRALVLANTFTSLPDLAQKLYPWLPARWLTRSQFNSIDRITRCNRPVFVTHGDCDGLIPCTMGERLHEAANSPKFYLPLPGMDHNLILPPEFYARLKKFLVEVEARPSPD
jgi:fermentation-respiration switch protein FrsA (DUF1100 family)